jgi:hypothetical protein
MNARLRLLVSRHALVRIAVARDLLERSIDVPALPFVYVARAAPSAANLDLPMFLAHQAE